MAGAAEIKNATAGIRGARPEKAKRTCFAHMSKLGIPCHLTMVQDCRWKAKNISRIRLFCASRENLKASLPQHGCELGNGLARSAEHAAGGARDRGAKGRYL